MCYVNESIHPLFVVYQLGGAVGTVSFTWVMVRTLEVTSMMWNSVVYLLIWIDNGLIGHHYSRTVLELVFQR